MGNRPYPPSVTDTLAAADDAYEAAEAAFLDLVRRQSDRAALRTASESVAEAAAAWNTLAYESLHAASGLDREALDLLTERTEVLAELWADLAAAYRV